MALRHTLSVYGGDELDVIISSEQIVGLVSVLISRRCGVEPRCVRLTYQDRKLDLLKTVKDNNLPKECKIKCKFTR